MHKRGYPVNSWHGNMPRRIRAKHYALLVYVPFIFEASVGRRTIGMYG